MNSLHVQCVYGKSHIAHIKKVLIPALRKSTRQPVKFLTINYDPKSPDRLDTGTLDGVDVVDMNNTSNKSTGFAENHNALFSHHQPGDSFIIINPDCIPSEGSIDALLKRKTDFARTAIVEGRQWPFEHPKEYDSLSLETPWASGAFCLIDAEFYRSIGGMDEMYFLYLEDVDLSWQAWLNGYHVLYEPAASVAHFSGGKFYRNDLVSHEQYLSLRNFLIISRKFFGEAGEQRAIKMLKNFSDHELATMAIDEYLSLYQGNISKKYCKLSHPKIKILGLNRYHEMRPA